MRTAGAPLAAGRAGRVFRLALAGAALAAVAVLGAGPAARAAALKSPPPPDIARVLDRGTLVVGLFSKDRPPFFMTGADGTLSGLDVSLSRDVAARLGVAVQFDRSATSFDELCEKAARGEVDVVISKLSRTLDRQKVVAFTRPYLQLRQALIVNRIAAVRLKIEDYPLDYLKTARVKIGALAGTSFVQYAAEMFPNAEIQEFPSWGEAVRAVRAGKVIAALYDDNEVIRLVRQNPDIALYVSIYVLKDKRDAIAMAVAADSTHLRDWLNAYLETHSAEMDVYDLIRDYPEIFREAGAGAPSP
jgi:ABC-type amino acid transport substrate-binding protein